MYELNRLFELIITYLLHKNRVPVRKACYSLFLFYLSGPNGVLFLTGNLHSLTADGKFKKTKYVSIHQR